MTVLVMMMLGVDGYTAYGGVEVGSGGVSVVVVIWVCVRKSDYDKKNIFALFTS